MQNLAEQHPILSKKLEENETMMEASWTTVWANEWNTSTWLMSSLISTLILGEIHAIVLSIYPNFMISIWLSLGIQSLLYTSLMTFLTILTLGVISGTLFYGAHLIIKSMNHFEYILHQWLEVWTQQTKHYTPGLIEQLNVENIEKITQILEGFPAATPLVQFLKNDKNSESIHQIVKLLKDIWSQESMDAQIKVLTIHLLTQYVQEDNAKLHINNIWILWEYLQKNPELNLQIMLKVLENSSQIQNLVEYIQNYSKQPDMIHHAFDKPEILPYVQAMEETFPQRNLGERAESTRQLFEDTTDSLISCQLFNHLQELDDHEKTIRMQLLNIIINHPQTQQIKTLLNEINTIYPSFFSDVNKTRQILKLFEKASSPELNITSLARILVQLDEHLYFSLINTYDIHLKNNLELINDLLTRYFQLSQEEKSDEKLQSIFEITESQWSEKEKDNFFKKPELTPVEKSEKIDQKPSKSIIRKASSLFKALKSKKVKNNQSTPTTDAVEEEQISTNPPESSTDLKKDWRLFKENKEKSSKNIPVQALELK